jgi:polyisoprenoid-binding protein YceI
MGVTAIGVLMRHTSLWNLAMATGLLAQAAAAGGRGPIVMTIDPDTSQVVIEVGKAGLFGFAGHAHEIVAPARGRVTFDPDDWQRSTVELEFDAAALRVTGKGEPAGDVPEVQRTMLSDQVLDVKRYPVVVFRSRRVSVEGRSGNASTVVIAGDLTLHGTTRPMTIRAAATLDAGGRLTARGSFSLKQTDFGIQPVTAGAGTVRVKDVLVVRFVLIARRSAE